MREIDQFLYDIDERAGSSNRNFSEYFQEKASEDVWLAKGELMLEVGKYLSETDLQDVNGAFDTAYYYHAETTEPVPGKRWRRTLGLDGQPQEYMVHPAGVAIILAKIGVDKDTIIASLLHDTKEDTQISEGEILENFGSNVAKTVETVTNITGIINKEGEERKQLAKKLTLSKLIFAFKEDPRAILVKLADRLHNMQTIKGLPEKRQNGFAQETLNYFVPMARIVNLDDWADELSDMAAFALWPNEARGAEEIIKEKYQDEIISSMQRDLEDENIEVSIRKPYVFEFLRRTEDGITIVDPNFWTIRVICKEARDIEKTSKYFKKRTFGLEKIEISKYGEERYIFNLFNAQVAASIYPWQSHLNAKASLADLYRVYYPDGNRLNLNDALGLLRSYAKIKLQAPQDRITNSARRFLSDGKITQKEELALATDTLEWMREGNPITVYTATDEIIPLNEGNTGLDFAFIISEDLGLKADSVLINDDPNLKPVHTVLKHNDVVVVNPEEFWTIDMSTLQFVQSEGARKVVKSKLKKILEVSDKYGNHIRLKVGEEGFESLTDLVRTMKIDPRGENKHVNRKILGFLTEPIPEDLKKSGFKTLMELELSAERIRQEGANLGQEKLIEIYRKNFPKMLEKRQKNEMRGQFFELRERPLIDLNRGFRKMDKDFRKKYGIYGKNVGGRQFRKFLVDCAIGDVKPEQMEKYIEALFNYEEDLPRKLFIVPNKPGVLRSFVDISPLFTNIVDIKQLANLPNVHDDRVGIELRFETETKRETGMVMEIWDIIEKVIEKPSLLKNVLSKIYKLPLPNNVSLIPFISLLESFDHTVGRVTSATDDLSRKLKIIPMESNGQNRSLMQDELYALSHFLKDSIMED